jgi:hypothetical protein
VRSLSSRKNPDFVSFPGGPPEEPLLSNKGGLNRMVWDMRTPTLPGVPNVYIEGSYRGHKVPPGEYSATLQVGTWEKKVSFRILSDPRLNYAVSAYQEQHAFLDSVEAECRDILLSILGLRKVKQQLKALRPLLENNKEWKPIQDKAQELTKKINDWEDELVQNQAQSNDDIINYVNKLSADYIFLKGEADVNIPYVTTGQREQLNQLSRRWQGYLATWKQLTQEDIPAFNKACREKGIETLVAPMREQ